jgi:hypothetical protein
MMRAVDLRVDTPFLPIGVEEPYPARRVETSFLEVGGRES